MMTRIAGCCFIYVVLYSLIKRCSGAIYTYEDVELRRIFPSEFPQDTIRKTGLLDPELRRSDDLWLRGNSTAIFGLQGSQKRNGVQEKHLGRYGELKSYFKYPKAKVNSHFEELVCYDREDRKLCRIDLERYSPEEDAFYMSPVFDSHVDRRRVYCFMLLCFTEDELDRVVASF